MRLGGAQRTEATGLGSAAMFSGALVMPSLAALVATSSGSYAIAYTTVGVLAVAAGVLLASGARHSRR